MRRKLIYEKESKTIRLLPENYRCLQFDEEQWQWIVNIDKAVPLNIATAIFAYVHTTQIFPLAPEKVGDDLAVKITKYLNFSD